MEQMPMGPARVDVTKIEGVTNEGPMTYATGDAAVAMGEAQKMNSAIADKENQEKLNAANKEKFDSVLTGMSVSYYSKTKDGSRGKLEEGTISVKNDGKMVFEVTPKGIEGLGSTFTIEVSPDQIVDAYMPKGQN